VTIDYTGFNRGAQRTTENLGLAAGELGTVVDGLPTPR
jgi:hypothetical protein